MPLAYPMLLRAPYNIEQGKDWAVQTGGFNVLEYACGQTGRYDQWFQGKLTGAVKRVSMQGIYDDGLAVSIRWKWLFKLDALTANDRIRFVPFANLAALDNSVVGFNGYGLDVIGDDTLELLALDGNSNTTSIIAPGWTADTDVHELIMTRRASFANRYWSLWLDRLQIVVDASNNTYAVSNYMGWELGTANRQQMGVMTVEW